LVTSGLDGMSRCSAQAFLLAKCAGPGGKSGRDDFLRQLIELGLERL
jgi:hypothetical protein